MSKKDNRFESTSPAKLIDLKAPADFAKVIHQPEPVKEELVKEWCFEHVTLPQFSATQNRIDADIAKRKEYLDEAFNNVIFDVTNEINELQAKVLLNDGGDLKIGEKIAKKQAKINELVIRKKLRHDRLEAMSQLSPKTPEILGCAYVVPLDQMEYKAYYGMQRDDDVEKIAMNLAMDYEKSEGWNPEDVSSANLGYDIRSASKDLLKRYIEVKGRSSIGGVMLSENEMFRLGQLADSAWLYIVFNCKSSPELVRINNPAKNLKFETKTKGIQYFLPENEWKKNF